MLCNDEELADMGFTVVDGNETPDPGREPLEAETDAYLAAADAAGMVHRVGSHISRWRSATP